MVCVGKLQFLMAMVVMLFAAVGASSAEPWTNPKARIPPRAKPSRIGGGESLPPLPLPATPLRRSEKKRQPAPPALVGLVNFQGRDARIVDGRRVSTAAFPTTQIDIERLMNVANRKLGIRYRYVRTNFGAFSWSPAELPLLYVTGWTPMPTFDAQTLAKLRRYLYDGGTLVVHAQCGRKAFVDSARVQLRRLFPDRPLAAVDTDSPLFHAQTDIESMRVRRDAEPFRRLPPYLEAIYLGCRPAVIFSPLDLNCGWNVARKPIAGGTLYHQDDALALGVNIIATVLANFEYAKGFAIEKVYHQQNDPTRDQLVIAQVVHEGDWDPTPHALPNLMKYIAANTRLSVQFKRQPVRLDSGELFAHPVLYMTGLRDFTLSEPQAAALKTYLQAGGLLVADAATGRKAFDVAFRREIQRVLGEAALAPIEADHPIYAMPYEIRSASFSPMQAAAAPAMNAPTLEGAAIDGRLAVIYSPLSLANGWEQLPYTYSRGYADADAIRLGVNIIAYGMMH